MRLVEEQQPVEEQQQPSDPKEDENEDKPEANRGFIEELLDNPLLSVPQVLEWGTKFQRHSSLRNLLPIGC
jgi:hypothetical protein